MASLLPTVTSGASAAAATVLPPPALPAWRLQPAEESLLPQIAEMERLSYPADEMCTPENFRYRLTHAQPFFKVAVAVADGGSSSSAAASAVPEVIGFVVGTLSVASKLHHEAMFNHAPEGGYLCIHSVVTSPSLRRRGLARAVLTEYVKQVRLEQSGKIHAIVLIAKADLVPFYVSCGFELQGLSDVVHGADEWFECRMNIPQQQPQQQPEEAQKQKQTATA